VSCSRGQRFRRGRRLDFATPKKRQGRRALSAISKTILMLIALNTPALGPAQASRCWGFAPIYLLGWSRLKIPTDRQAGSPMRDKFFSKYRILRLWLCLISAARSFEHKRLDQNLSDDPEHHPCQKATCIGGFKNKSDGYVSLGVVAKNMDDHHARAKIMRQNAGHAGQHVQNGDNEL